MTYADALGADLDLEEIWLHVASKNAFAADRLLANLETAEQRLLQYPLIGRSRADILTGVRSWTVGNYIIFYLVNDELLEVVRIIHGARDLDVELLI